MSLIGTLSRRETNKHYKQTSSVSKQLLRPRVVVDQAPSYINGRGTTSKALVYDTQHTLMPARSKCMINLTF